MIKEPNRHSNNIYKILFQFNNFSILCYDSNQYEILTMEVKCFAL